MKKTLLLLLTSTIILSCGTTKQKSYPDYVLGINENIEKKIFDKDSLNIVTPNIEIYNRVNNISERKYDDREVIKTFVIKTLKSELNKAEHFELKLMSEDYLTVNKILEMITYHKFKNPEWIVKAPEEILISEKKYTILITMTARYGDTNNGVIYFCVINNYNKIIESVDRYEFNGSPLNNKQTKKRIQKAIARITNT
ncbi:hypothetical protein [Gillisia hiemivivida]|jgi:hypothetical protein|uniref:Lipoprotein n=1 Tax=Gillisia hiemivivida TaxID=291190 RepID=A0A5C6ZV14_9FLAO|nr:hypothetical protein [Gillisia hiemivivida]TXD94481.1 hypothetical protein ES724_05575 [Gillisia hiemivivida]